MNRILPRLSVLVLSLLVMLVPADRLEASITSVTASPSSIQINTNGTSTVRLRWSVTATNSVPVVVASPVGDVLDGASVLASPGGTLSRSVNTPGATTIQFSETIIIGRTLAKTLATGGTITYRRTFNDGGTSLQAFVPIVISSGGQIAYRNINLRFDTGQTYASVPRGASLAAEAVVSLSGNGVLDATWQVARLTGGQPGSFKPLRRIRRAVSGRGQLVLSSPALPTLQDGIYAVRLVPNGESVDLADVFPVIRYAVAGGDADLLPLRLNTPAAGAVIVPQTLFSWTSVAGADSYRVEFARPDGDGQRLVAGVELPATATSTRLKSFTLSKIRQEGASHWRVLALAGDGRVMAAAPYRRLSGGSDQLSRER